MTFDLASRSPSACPFSWPAAGIVVSELISEQRLDQPQGLRKLNQAGMRAVDLAAEQVADKVDGLLGKAWSSREGKFAVEPEAQEMVATCSCGSGIPIQKVIVNGQERTLVALPLIFQKFCENGRVPLNEIKPELMAMVKIYNQIDPADETSVERVVWFEYSRYWRQHAVKS